MYWWEYAPGASQHVPFVGGTGPSSLAKSWATNVMLPSQIWWWNIPGLTVSPCLAVVKVRILAAGAACMLCRLIMPAYHSIRQQRISRLAKKASVFYVWSGIWGSAVCVGGFPRVLITRCRTLQPMVCAAGSFPVRLEAVCVCSAPASCPKSELCLLTCIVVPESIQVWFDSCIEVYILRS